MDDLCDMLQVRCSQEQACAAADWCWSKDVREPRVVEALRLASLRYRDPGIEYAWLACGRAGMHEWVEASHRHPNDVRVLRGALTRIMDDDLWFRALGAEITTSLLRLADGTTITAAGSKVTVSSPVCKALCTLAHTGLKGSVLWGTARHCVGGHSHVSATEARLGLVATPHHAALVIYYGMQSVEAPQPGLGFALCALMRMVIWEEQEQRANLAQRTQRTQRSDQTNRTDRNEPAAQNTAAAAEWGQDNLRPRKRARVVAAESTGTIKDVLLAHAAVIQKNIADATSARLRWNGVAPRVWTWMSCVYIGTLVGMSPLSSGAEFLHSLAQERQPSVDVLCAVAALGARCADAPQVLDRWKGCMHQLLGPTWHAHSYVNTVMRAHGVSLRADVQQDSVATPESGARLGLVTPSMTPSMTLPVSPVSIVSTGSVGSVMSAAQNQASDDTTSSSSSVSSSSSASSSSSDTSESESSDSESDDSEAEVEAVWA